ncbi:MAG TPA: S41 family peptidase [Pyrinomonadaceae bacterium]|nr:S41 family peptidase [Pyrinomonadaceae bacterium]
MGLQKCIYLVGLTCVFFSHLAVGQGGRFAPAPKTQLPDPFSVSVGSSFIASGPSRPTADRAAVISKELISADIDEALAVIRQSYAGNGRVSSDSLIGFSIDSMLKALDPHSNFYDAAEFQELLGEHLSEYTGTGSSIAGFERDRQIETFIISTFPDSPAAKAGLRFGDKITAVNGRYVRGESLDAVRDLVRGKRGTTVRITVERPGSPSPLTFELKREVVHEPAVPAGFLISGKIGFIDLTNGFSNSTFPELENALTELHRQGMLSLVLDLRGNGGGILDQAVKVAEKFLPAGSVILTQKGRTAADSRTWKAVKPRYETLPLVLLVDENTASASEVLAGALQDNDRALVIGRKTFGKGLVQNVLDLPQGTGLTLTAARYFTPTGRSIQRDYSEIGLYDYFNHRGTAVDIDKPLYAARTLTGRTVYGGDGITPDVTVPRIEFTAERLRLLDRIFLFSRDYLNGAGPQASNVMTAAQTIRQKILFGDPAVDAEVLSRFNDFLRSELTAEAIIGSAGKESAFVRNMLGYYLAMGSFGRESALREMAATDSVVQKAITELPNAGRLSAAALRIRNRPRKEKSSLSLVLNEQR